MLNTRLFAHLRGCGIGFFQLIEAVESYRVRSQKQAVYCALELENTKQPQLTINR